MTAVTSTMTAPLSLFLTRFSTLPSPMVVTVEIAPPEPTEPTFILTQSELDARLEAAAQAARSEADRHHASELDLAAARHGAALAEAVAMARIEWTETEGKQIAAQIDVRLTDLRNMIADRLARVLRSLLEETVRTRTTQALTETIDRLLADPSRPAIRVCGPDDLLAALRAARPAAGIEWVAAHQTDVTITAGAAQIQTRLAAALAEIVATGD